MTSPTLESALARVQKIAVFFGAAGTLVCIAGFWTSSHNFAFSYLIAFLYWTGIFLGALPILMIHNLTGGNWGLAVRRTLETQARQIPFLIFVFLPILFLARELYPWLNPEVLRHDAILQAKQVYLNLPFFTFRSVMYFLVWSGMAFLVIRDFKVHDTLIERRSQASGLGLVLYVLTITFSSLDWGMSLEPHWSSTIYGFIFMIGQTLSGFAFVILTALVLSKYEPFTTILPENRRHDLGTLLFVFIMLWAYVSLSQFLIIWSGNIPELTPWYYRRFHGGWQIVGILLPVFHFLVPFFLLLMRALKKNVKSLTAIVVLILVMRWVDLFYILKPASSETILFHPLDLAAMAAVGGWLVALFASRLKNASLALEADPLWHKKSGGHS